MPAVKSQWMYSTFTPASRASRATVVVPDAGGFAVAGFAQGAQCLGRRHAVTFCHACMMFSQLRRNASYGASLPL